MSIDPTIARARIEISSDQLLLKQLISGVSANERPRNQETQARINSLRRLIAANEKLLGRLVN